MVISFIRVVRRWRRTKVPRCCTKSGVHQSRFPSFPDAASNRLEYGQPDPRRKAEHVDQSAQHVPPAKSNTKREVNDPNRTSFELQLNSEMAVWLAGASSANAQRTLSGRLSWCSRGLEPELNCARNPGLAWRTSNDDRAIGRRRRRLA
jgi:hypothetical protein